MEIDGANEHQQSNLKLKAFGSDSMSGLGQQALNQTAGCFHNS
jgi:hypothetical protein